MKRFLIKDLFRKQTREDTMHIWEILTTTITNTSHLAPPFDTPLLSKAVAALTTPLAFIVGISAASITWTVGIAGLIAVILY